MNLFQEKYLILLKINEVNQKNCNYFLFYFILVFICNFPVALCPCFYYFMCGNYRGCATAETINQINCDKLIIINNCQLI